MTSTLTWTKQRAGYWSAGNWIAISNFPSSQRGWTLLYQDRRVGMFQTLGSARQHAEGVAEGSIRISGFSVEHVFSD